MTHIQDWTRSPQKSMSEHGNEKICSGQLFPVTTTIASLVYRLKISFPYACEVIAARARCILFKISSSLAFHT